jgi:hydroxymethylpyrimidine kinase/phosphomethylpyrimidine kinase/thiamine-phosphate diphosphorylase
VISVLTIAGSDPGGGAGIQQDLKVFQVLGIAGLSAITAITVQNSRGVQSVHPVAPDLLGAQIAAVLEDATDLRAVKIGMLGGAEQVRVVADALRRYRPPNVVLDPVLASSDGVPLLDSAGLDALVAELVPLCDLITPNAHEAELLTRQSFAQDDAGIQVTGDRLLALGANAVLLKGGHLPGGATDHLFTPEYEQGVPFFGERIDSTDMHGTGCFLSSAIAGYLAQGDHLSLAINRAKFLLENGLRAPFVAGRGPGYPVARTGVFTEGDSHESRLARLRGVYVLTDPDLRPDRSSAAICAAALAGGAEIVQLRNKRLSTPDLIREAREILPLARKAQALFIVNDRVDVALASNADGVHLGPDDMSPRDARRLMGPQKLIGVSVSTVEEARARAPYASYLAVGAIFGSATKSDAGDAVGVARIREIKAVFPNKPIVAIGGIDSSNIGKVIAAGADAAAVISAVACAPDMTAATAALAGRFPQSA